LLDDDPIAIVRPPQLFEPWTRARRVIAANLRRRRKNRERRSVTPVKVWPLIFEPCQPLAVLAPDYFAHVATRNGTGVGTARGLIGCPFLVGRRAVLAALDVHDPQSTGARALILPVRRRRRLAAVGPQGFPRVAQPESVIV